MELKEEETRTKWERKRKGLNVWVFFLKNRRKINSEPTMCKQFCQDPRDRADQLVLVSSLQDFSIKSRNQI